MVRSGTCENVRVSNFNVPVIYRPAQLKRVCVETVGSRARQSDVVTHGYTLQPRVPDGSSP